MAGEFEDAWNEHFNSFTKERLSTAALILFTNSCIDGGQTKIGSVFETPRSLFIYCTCSADAYSEFHGNRPENAKLCMAKSKLKL